MNTFKCASLTLLIAAVELLVGGSSWAENWQEFKSPVGKFSIQFPGKPSYSKDQVNTDIGKQTTHKYVLQASDGETMWAVYFEDFPDWYFSETSEEEAMDQRASEYRRQSRSFSDKAFATAGIAGREVRFSVGEKDQTNAFLVRFFIVGDRMYELVVAQSRSLPQQTEMDKFLGSFRLLR